MTVSDLSEYSFQVLFSPTQNFQENKMKLTFFGSGQPLEITKLKIKEEIFDVVEKCNQCKKISDITEIIFNTDVLKKEKYATSFIILYNESGLDEKQSSRKGLLFGISKEGEQELLGLWPYNFFKETQNNSQIIEEKLVEIKQTPDIVSELLLVLKK